MTYINVYPQHDLKKHIMNLTCPCNPKQIKPTSGPKDCITLVHHSWDRREIDKINKIGKPS